MISAWALSGALFCAAIWAFMTLTRKQVLNGLWRKTWMIGGLGFGAVGVVFLAMGL